MCEIGGLSIVKDKIPIEIEFQWNDKKTDKQNTQKWVSFIPSRTSRIDWLLLSHTVIDIITWYWIINMNQEYKHSI